MDVRSAFFVLISESMHIEILFETIEQGQGQIVRQDREQIFFVAEMINDIIENLFG